ncbi:biotin synthase [Coccidioides immitis RS]|uniref:biotin synthase n=4 Tax=Coccidioides immitis TaxID=5501 RepID=A0A0E1RZP4_COCIM|nr:biotin synthase [Coccidioides immitis RS]KMP01259.1 biotin synthase [Coccidioides immitis RMSCC 2394]KMU75458.1 biotin synthase [Coccidioides immitis RMSCC 3703]KMU83766.1 biotin synthase [Coccidioides immitis H538.4]TPX25854.1 biotin synthase [Coccidioides immitis]EAS35962.1 biotin synthase [Coccidioides immitis RS]
MAALSLPRATVSRTLFRRSYGTVQNTIISPVASASSSSAGANSALQEAVSATAPRMNWTREEIQKIYDAPLTELTYASATVHRRFHDPAAIQMCTLMNIKTGGCSEDCSYCAQSSRYKTGLKATKLSSVDSVLEAARVAKENGSTRFCMGAAWRDMRGRKTNLRNIKEMVSGVRAMGMEVCVTLGMIDGEQAKELKDAGLTAYNHNLDTSREFYPSIITTRSYDERLQTLEHVRDAGINVCSGGILGLGEQDSDRVGLIHTVATLPSHPESFPVNALVPIKGTPLGERKMISFDKVLRTVATARIVLPMSIVRLAAGRISMTEEQQVTCFQAGANAIFTGEKMLTTDCSGWDEDKKIFDKWGYYPMAPFERGQYKGKMTAHTSSTPVAPEKQVQGQIQAEANV